MPFWSQRFHVDSEAEVVEERVVELGLGVCITLSVMMKR